MERVAFLLEDTGEQIGCLLNPESLVLRRRAGVEPRETAGGLVSGAELADNQLLFTGGGTTEIDLDLLFDVSLAGSSIVSDDVRNLTAPIWDLAENTRRSENYGQPPKFRLVWGKSWNIPAVVVAIAERLEHFTPGGVPTRSWLRMRLSRIGDFPSIKPVSGVYKPSVGEGESLAELLTELAPEVRDQASQRAGVHELRGAVDTTENEEEAGGCDERLDQVAYSLYGDPEFWRLIAGFNDISNPLSLRCGSLLLIPRLSDFGLKL